MQLENNEDTVTVARLRPFYGDEADHHEPVTDVVDRLRPFYEDEADHHEPVTDVVDRLRPFYEDEADHHEPVTDVVNRLRPFYEDEADHHEPVTNVVDTGKSGMIDDLVDDLVVRRSDRTVSPPIRRYRIKRYYRIWRGV